MVKDEHITTCKRDMFVFVLLVSIFESTKKEPLQNGPVLRN